MLHLLVDSTPCNVTYNFIYDGDIKFTQTSKAAIGVDYPAINVKLPYGVSVVDNTIPNGTISESDVDGGAVTKEIELTITNNVPFEAAATVDAITNWYYMQMQNEQPTFLGDTHDGAKIHSEWGNTVDAAAPEEYVWGFVGNIWDGFTVVNKGTGRQINDNSGNITTTDNGTAFIATAAAASVKRENAFCLKVKSSDNWLNANHGAQKVTYWTDNGGGSVIWLTEYESYTTEITSAKYATLYLDYAAYIPEDVKAYTGAINGNYITLNEITGTIPANTGVILEGEQGEYTFSKSMATAAEITGNILEGSNEKKEYPDGNYTYYILANDEEGVCFYADEFTGGIFVNNAHKAFFKVAKTSDEPVKYSFRFPGEGTTGIEGVETVENAVYYDLSGRRVENPVKGIYIVNGKKVLVK